MVGEPPPTRQRIDLTCPECGHVQQEPALVVSTQCKACRAHIQVADGKALARPKPLTRLAPPRPDPEPTAPLPPTPPKPSFKPSPPTPRRIHPLLRWILRPKPLRQIACFDCGHLFTAAPEAQSSQCPRCSCYISLADHTIDDHWNRSIRTRGNVTILKGASLTATRVECHHLTVIGQLDAPASCSGTATFRNHGKITGPLNCHHLRIERRCRVEFMQPVHAHQATIHGHARGQLNCSGTVTLEKHASLTGYVRAANLTGKRGASHHGTFEKIPPPAT